MRTATRVLGLAGAFALVAGTAAAQDGNDATFNNAADFYTLLSQPSVGSSTGTNPPNINGDLFWRAFSGADFMYDVAPDYTDPVFGNQHMEITGYFEALLCEFWNDPDPTYNVNFLDRMHGPAVVGASGALEPSFFSGPFSGTETLVVIGASGYKSPCTLYPSLCSPFGSSCAPGGGAWSWIVDLTFGTTPGAGIVMPADGTTASDMATTYFIQGGWQSSGGLCGIGTNQTSLLISTDETQLDTTGLGINTMSGFQAATSGPIAWGQVTTIEPNVQFRGNIVQMRADTGSGLGVEESDNGGGATNGEFLSVGSGLATIGVELRDWNGPSYTNIGVCGMSGTVLPGGGFAALGGNLLILPTGLFVATSSAWTGPVVVNNPWFTTEGRFIGIQLPVPPAVPVGTVLYTQGATFNLVSGVLDSTNVAATNLGP